MIGLLDPTFLTATRRASIELEQVQLYESDDMLEVHAQYDDQMEKWPNSKIELISGLDREVFVGQLKTSIELISAKTGKQNKSAKNKRGKRKGQSKSISLD